MSLTLLNYALWLGAPVMQGAALLYMRKRGLQREFHFFQTYTIFQILSVAVLFTVFHLWSDAYFYVYWVNAALGIGLGFAVIHEVFAYAIKPYVGLRDLALMLFRWAAIMLVLVSGLIAFSGSGNDMQRVLREIMNLERAVRMIQVGLLVFLFMFSSYLGLPWRNFAFGVTFGFGLFATTDLVLFSMRSSLGSDWNNTFNLISAGVYNLACLFWMGYAMQPATANARVKLEYHPVFDRWNQAATSMQQTRGLLVDKEHTSLADILTAVENVMQKNGGK